MTPKAIRFMRENKKSKVVSGGLILTNGELPSKGIRYTLENGKHFRLSTEDVKDMPMPEWRL